MTMMLLRSVYLPPELLQKVEDRAKQECLGTSAVIRQAVYHYFKGATKL